MITEDMMKEEEINLNNQMSKHVNQLLDDQVDMQEKKLLEKILVNTDDQSDFEIDDESFMQANIFEKKEILEAYIKAVNSSEVHADIVKEYEDQDALNRTCFHICCLDHNFKMIIIMFRRLISSATDYEECMKSVRKFVLQVDYYNNNPLMLACIYPEKPFQLQKRNCINFMIQCGSQVNIRNAQSGFTPLHWIARHGELDILKNLIEEGKAEAFVPDNEGLFPLDYAGFFKHYEVVLYLIEHLVGRLEKPIMKQDQQFPFKQIELLRSPLLKANILYWACSLPENILQWSRMKEFMTKHQMIPECQNAIEKNMTAFHRAAKSGNHMKLQVILQNINKRMKIHIGQKNSIKPNQSDLFSKIRQQLVKQGLKKYLQMYDNFGKRQIWLQREAQNGLLDFDFVDDDGMTPLHYSCQFCQTESTKILLLEYGSSIDPSNEAGFRPRDLQQYDKIKEIFKNFYEKVDNAIKIRQNYEVNGKLKSTKEIMSDLQQVQQRHYDMDEVTEEYKDNSPEDTDKICYRNLLRHYYESKSINDQDTELIRKIVRYRKWLPEVSLYALKVSIQESTFKRKVNQMIQTLINQNFIVRMFPSADNPQTEFFITLELPLEELEIQAEIQGYKMKLLECDLKYQYLKAHKERYEPFRSKDMLEIIGIIFKKFIDIEELRRLGIIQDHFILHDPNAISDVQHKWKQTSLANLIIQSFGESYKIEYHALTALKNYFGERWAFIYMFNYFFVNWMILPSLFALLVTIIQLENQSFATLWAFSYSIFICLWITIFIEKLKRKQSIMRLIWGVSILDDVEEKIRVEFRGNEQFNPVDHRVNKVDEQSWRISIKILNLFIMLFFMSICISSFFITQNHFGMFSGVGNGIIIIITNFLYEKSVVPLIQLENHKYEERFNDSFIQKVYFFQFINANISIMYKIYNGAEWEQLYTILLGMITTKVFQLFFKRVVKNFAIFNIKKYLYFKNCAARAENQQKQYENIKLSSDEKDNNDIIEQDKQGMEIFRHKILNDKRKRYEWKRLVSTFGADQDSILKVNEQLWVDQVELNSRMAKLRTIDELKDISETFILFAQVTIYSLICPVASIIVFIAFAVMLRFERINHLFYVQRQPLVNQNSLGSWLTILKFQGYITLITNCLILFWFREIFAFRINETLNFLNLINDEGNFGQRGFEIVQFILSLALIQNLVIVLQLMIDYLINDKPSWVQKREEKTRYDIDQMNSQIKELERKKTIQRLQYQIIHQKKTVSGILEKVSNNYKKIMNQFKSGNQQSILPRIDQKQRNSFQEITEDSMPTEPKLKMFIEKAVKKKLDGVDGDLLEKKLNEQIMKRLYREVYNAQEKAILQRRLEKIGQIKLQIVNCTECQVNLAEIQCHDCDNDHFCQDCFKNIHPSSNQKFYNHRINQISRQSAKPLKNRNNLSDDHYCEQNQWTKYEQFNFPLPEHNDLFDQLKYYFQFLKQNYIHNNYIDDLKNQADIALVLLDRNDELFNNINIPAVDVTDLLKDNSMFNDEELLYLNRLSFYLVSKHGSRIHFSQFIRDLKTLQDGSFSEKVDLLLAMFKQRENQEEVEVDSFLSFLLCSMPQNSKNKSLIAKNILLQIFEGKEYVQFKKLRNVLKGCEGEVRNILNCVLQI